MVSNLYLVHEFYLDPKDPDSINSIDLIDTYIFETQADADMFLRIKLNTAEDDRKYRLSISQVTTVAKALGGQEV